MIIKRLVIAAATVAIVATPASAGVTDRALAVCRAAVEQAAPGNAASIRKIVEGGRRTKIHLWVHGSDKRAFDCVVPARGPLVAAFAPPQGQAFATAD